MSKDIFEVRFHGRGGQGAKTAAALLAEVAIFEGKHIQSFPEYGAERQGAPVKAFTRISDKPITIHCGVTNPNIVVVVDPTLLKSIPITEGLEDDGILLVNSDEPADEIRKQLNYTGKLFIVDATKIAVEELGRPITNTAMLGALEKATNIVVYDDLKNRAKEHFTHHLGEELAQKNINAMERAYNDVKEA